MKRLGRPMEAIQPRWGIALSAILVAAMLSACGAKKASLDAQAPGDDDFPMVAESGDDIAANDVNSIVQGAFDQSGSGSLTGGQQPGNLGSASQQQSFCTNGSSAGTSFFTQLTQSPSFFGSSQSACFTGQVAPTQFMYASYGQLAVINLCQSQALGLLNFFPDTPEANFQMYALATQALANCTVNAISQFEGRLGYGPFLANGAQSRMAAIRAAGNALIEGLNR